MTGRKELLSRKKEVQAGGGPVLQGLIQGHRVFPPLSSFTHDAVGHGTSRAAHNEQRVNAGAETLPVAK